MDERNLSNITLSPSLTSVPAPSLAELIFVGVNAFICVAGTTVNLITIATILKHDRKGLGVQNLLVLNFCLANLLFCMIAGDTSRRMLTSPFYDIHLCRFRAFSLYVIMNSSVYSLLLISFNRYFIIIFPQSRFAISSIRKAVILICVEWLTCVLIMLPPITGLWGLLGFEKATRSCTLIRDKSKTFSHFFQIINFLAPLLIHTFCYGHIFITVKRQNRKMLKSTSNSASQGRSVSKGLHGRRRRQEWNLTLLTLCIIVTYVVCFLPYTLSTLTSLINTPFHTFAVAFLWTHIVINPIIYLIGDTRLRQTLMFMLHCKGNKSNCNGNGLSQTDGNNSMADMNRAVVSQPLNQEHNLQITTTDTKPENVCLTGENVKIESV